MSSSALKAERRELELRKARAETKIAELELKEQRRRDERYARKHQIEHKGDTEAKGVFYLIGEVTTESCAFWGNKISRFARLNPGERITLYIQSPGGSVLAGFGLFDELRTLSLQGNKITTVVRGYAASMGAVLLQAGDQRLVGAESYVMLHEITSGSFGKLHEMRNDMERVEKFNRRVFEILAGKTDGKWGADKLYKRVRAEDWWIGAEEAVEHGFADAVG